MQNYKLVALCLLSGFVGGLVAGKVQVSWPGSANAEAPRVVQATGFNLVDQKGKLRAQLGMAKEGAPGLWLMDEKGTARVAIGVYGDGTGHVVLNDPQGLANQILRSFGPKETPLHIFKTNGQDMMIMGLNPDAAATPFLFFYDDKRARKLEFGKYSGP